MNFEQHNSVASARVGQLTVLFIFQVRVADLPGLIEGASSNRGLGHAFLKHTEKAKALALVVSGGLCEKKIDLICP